MHEQEHEQAQEGRSDRLLIEDVIFRGEEFFVSDHHDGDEEQQNDDQTDRPGLFRPTLG